MAIKSSNVIARVEPEIKEQAEHILAKLGISASNGINMFYRQIILWNGLPFRPSIPSTSPKSLTDMSKDEFDLKLTRAFMQAKAGEGIAADEFFESLKSEVIKSHAE
ncbi:MAG: type II toxin-antitoxin system RelB/DinJ family antitoxin [Ruminococcaceae bacterium]|nr:type II toxin-antitoxin system RelB/DinJ family antitoxin [Oscillospiraceae bacterium]